MSIYTQYGSKIVPSFAGSPQIGVSVSIYKNTAVLGGPRNSGGASSSGSIWIYTLVGTVWTLQQEIDYNVANAHFGTSVSIYENTLAVGIPANSTGAVIVYTRSGSTWTLQQTITLPGDGAGESNFGTSVSLYRDTLAIGANGSSIGAGWVFTRTGTVWTVQGSKIVGTGASASGQGASISVYQDALAIGGPLDSSSIGAVWTFTRSTVGTWSQVGSKIVPGDRIGAAHIGASVSIYSTSMAFGGYTDNTNIGATWIYTFSAGSWSEQQKLIGTGGTLPGQGTSTSLFGDIVVTGGPNNNNSVGAFWIFTRSGTTWTQSGTLRTPSDTSPASSVGASVSIYNNDILIGAPADDSFTGAGWIYYYTTLTNTSFTTGSINSTFPENHYSQHSVGGTDILTLTSGKFFIGNSSGLIAENTMSGDATMTSTGVITLANSGVTVAPYSVGSLTINGKGLITNVDTDILIFGYGAATSGSVSIPNATITAASSLFTSSFVTNTPSITYTSGVITINKTGIYLLSMQSYIQNTAGGTPNNGFRQMYVSINSTPYVMYNNGGYSTFDVDFSSTAVYSLTAGDTLTLYGFQFDDAGVAKSIFASQNPTMLVAYRLYPSVYTVNVQTGSITVPSSSTPTQITTFSSSTSSLGISISSGNVTIASDGFYILTYQVAINTKSGTMSAWVDINGTKSVWNVKGSTSSTAGANFVGYCAAGGMYSLNTGDVLKLFTAQNSGSSATTTITNVGIYFNITKIITSIYGIAFGSVATTLVNNALTSFTTSTFTNYFVSGGIYVSLASPFTYKIQVAGTYYLSYQIPTNVSTGTVQTYILQNSANRFAHITSGALNTINISGTSYGIIISTSLIVQLAVGDTLELQYFQNTGSSQALITTVPTYFNVIKID